VNKRLDKIFPKIGNLTFAQFIMQWRI